MNVETECPLCRERWPLHDDVEAAVTALLAHVRRRHPYTKGEKWNVQPIVTVSVTSTQTLNDLAKAVRE